MQLWEPNQRGWFNDLSIKINPVTIFPNLNPCSEISRNTWGPRRWLRALGCVRAARQRLPGWRGRGGKGSNLSLLVGGVPSPCIHVGVGFHTILSPKCLPGVEHICIKKYLSELLVLASDALTCTHLPCRKFLQSD